MASSPQVLRDTQIYWAGGPNLGENISQPISAISKTISQQDRGYSAPTQGDVTKDLPERPHIYKTLYGSQCITTCRSQYNSPYGPYGLSTRGLQYFSPYRHKLRAQVSSQDGSQYITPYRSQYNSPYGPYGLSIRGLQYFSPDRPELRAQVSSQDVPKLGRYKPLPSRSPALISSETSPNQRIVLQKPSELTSDQGSHLPIGGNIPNNSISYQHSNFEALENSSNKKVSIANDVSQGD